MKRGIDSRGRVVLALLMTFTGMQAEVSAQEEEGGILTRYANTFFKDTVPVEGDITSDLSLRTRYEGVNWWAAEGVGGLDPNNNPIGSADDYGFASHRMNLGFRYKTPGITGYLQGQHSQLYDLVSDRDSGPGRDYLLANSFEDYAGDIYIRQGYLEVSDKEWLPIGLDARVGRFLYRSGREVPTTGDETVDWLKSNRIGERLLGTADYQFGRSYDGVGGNYLLDRCLGTLSLNLMHPTQGVYTTDGFVPIRDIDLLTAAWTSNNEGWPGEGELQLFFYYYEDGRTPSDEGIVRLDNRPLFFRENDEEHVNVDTYGAHWVQQYPVGPVTLEHVFWGVLQGGRWGEQSHRAGAWTAEGGVRFDEALGTPWVRLGWSYGSGDSDPNDDDHQTLFQLLPSDRMYASIPAYNMMNTQDLFTQVVFTPAPALELTASAHYLWLNETDDLVYSGAGANERKDRFGFYGVSAAGEDKLGTVLDVQFKVALHEDVEATLYYGRLFGDNVAEANFVDEDIDYAFGQLDVKL